MKFSTYGRLVLLDGLLVGVPLAVLPFYPAEARYAPAFLLPMFVSVLLGFLISAAASRRRDDERPGPQPEPPLTRRQRQHSSLPVLFIWFYSFLLGAFPFYLGGQLPFVRALFESVGGWTTTGLTVVNITALPKIYLFYRSFMQFCGGIGFILMMVMVVQGKQAMTLFSAEGHLDRLKPNLKDTSRVIFTLYMGFLVAGTLAYRLFGMDLFDAVVHGMSALSTAGFTTQLNSIGHYGSYPIELVTIVLMLIGASNFAVLLQLAEGKLRQLHKVSELRFMFALIAVFTLPAAVSLADQTDLGIFQSFHNALFGVVTALSTTGYSTMAYTQWPPFSVGLLLILMTVGGCAGSTAGGLKLSRVYILLRAARENLRKRLSPALKVSAPSYRTVRGPAPIDNALIAETAGFLICYTGVYVVGTLLLTLTARCSLFDAMFEFAAVLSTAGITNGLTATAGTPALIVEMAGMILGRLEIFLVLAGFNSLFTLLLRRRKPRHTTSIASPNE